MRVFVVDPTVGRSQLGHSLVSSRILSSMLGETGQFYLFGPEAGTDIPGLGGPVVTAFPAGYRHVLRRSEQRPGFNLSRAISSIAARLSGRGGSDSQDGFAEKLAAALAECNAGADDHLVIASGSTTIVGIVLEALARMPHDRQPSLHVRMFAQRFDDPMPHEDDTMRMLKAYWSGHPGRVFVYTETDALKHVLERRYGFDGIETFLLPINMPQEHPHGETAGHAGFAVGFIGPVRRDKGAYRLASIMKELAAIRADAGLERKLRFVFQDDGKSRARRIRKDIEALAGDGFEADILVGELDDAAFARALAQCDALVLPYDPAAYAIRGSGIVSDAVAFRVPLVISRGMAMAEWIADGNGLEAQSDREFAECLLRIEQQPEIFADACARAAARLTQAHANNPMIRRIMGPACP